MTVLPIIPSNKCLHKLFQAELFFCNLLTKLGFFFLSQILDGIQIY